MLFCSFSLLPQVQKPVDDRKKPLMFFINKRYPDIEFIRPYQLIIHDILLRYNQVIKLPLVILIINIYTEYVKLVLVVHG